MSRLSLEELVDVLDMADDVEFEDVDVGGGKVIPVRGATPAEYVTCVVRRIPAERAKFLGSVRAGFEEASAEAASKAGQRVEPAFDFLGFVEAQLDSGPEGMAALVAACAGYGGNEAVERRFVRHPRLGDLYAVADRKTRGTTPESHAAFSEAVGGLIWGAPMQTPEPSSPASAAA